MYTIYKRAKLENMTYRKTKSDNIIMNIDLQDQIGENKNTPQ